MGTSALIVVPTSNNTYDCISVHYDGYIKQGVGELLYRYWKNTDEIKKLCAQKKEIRNFGIDLNDIDYFPNLNNKDSYEYLKSFKNMSWEKVANRAGNYDYTYYWFEPEEPNTEGIWCRYDLARDDFDDLCFFFNH